MPFRFNQTSQDMGVEALVFDLNEPVALPSHSFNGRSSDRSSATASNFFSSSSNFRISSVMGLAPLRSGATLFSSSGKVVLLAEEVDDNLAGEF